MKNITNQAAGPLPRTKADVGFLSSGGKVNHPGIKCECGEWRLAFTPALGAPGWHGVPVKCPSCRSWFLVVMRVAKVESVVVFTVEGLRRIATKGVVGIRHALTTPRTFPGMTEDDVEFICTVAELSDQWQQRSGAA